MGGGGGLWVMWNRKEYTAGQASSGTRATPVKRTVDLTEHPSIRDDITATRFSVINMFRSVLYVTALACQ